MIAGRFVMQTGKPGRSVKLRGVKMTDWKARAEAWQAQSKKLAAALKELTIFGPEDREACIMTLAALTAYQKLKEEGSEHLAAHDETQAAIVKLA